MFADRIAEHISKEADGLVRSVKVNTQGINEREIQTGNTDDNSDGKYRGLAYSVKFLRANMLGTSYVNIPKTKLGSAGDCYDVCRSRVRELRLQFLLSRGNFCHNTEVLKKKKDYRKTKKGLY